MMDTSFQDLLARARREIREIQPEDLHARLGRGEGIRVLDVRERDEWESGCLEGAAWIPRGFLELRIEKEVPDRTHEIAVYCAGGVRSALAAKALQDLGYTRVFSLAGGITAWREQGLPLARPDTLPAGLRSRYARHLRIPEVGEAGQRRLLSSRVLIVGAGGLGSPAALYLAAAGVGTLGIVDDDAVDESNLQRQILHRTEWIGRPKAESARQALLGLNPTIEVRPIRERLSSRNARAILDGYDVIVDGSDNFPTRYLVNDGCVFLGRPNVHGSIFRFDGQVTAFVPGQGACYRCLYPEPPAPEVAPSCSEAGVLGVLPGVIGVLQAVEAIKILLGRGKPLAGRLLVYDALEASFQEIRYERDPDCPVCGDEPAIRDFIDYEGFCRGQDRSEA